MLVHLWLCINFAKSDIHRTQHSWFLSFCWDTWICEYLCLLIRGVRYGCWYIPCCRHNLLQSVRSCPFWAKPIFMPMNTHNFSNCVILFRHMLNVIILLPFTFPFQPGVSFRHCLSSNRVQFPCDSPSCCGCCYRCHAHSLGLHFQAAWLPCLFVAPGQVLCVGFILPCRSFKQLPLCCVKWLFTKMARWLPCIWIIVL